MKHFKASFREADGRPIGPAPVRARREEDIGLLLGLVGVVIFAATLPLTRLAVPALGAPFLTAGRALIAGLIALPVLAASRRAPPWRRMPRLGLAALCLVVGFPGFSSLAMRSVPAAHAAVVIGVLPLATALAAALIGRERPSPSFWVCAALGAALVGGFALHRGGGALQPGDALLLLAIAAAAFGYALAGQLSREMPARDVISWIVVLALPVSAPLTWAFAPAQPALVPASAWAGLAYLGTMSMYLGFFAWNAGLARGGVARVAQTQLAQPFITIALSAPLLGERIDAETVLFAALVVASVFVGRRQAVPARADIPRIETRDRWLSSLLWRLAGWPFRVAAARRTMRDLAGMSAHELADIGLSRQDLRDASALPLGDDPTRILVMRVAERARR